MTDKQLHDQPKCLPIMSEGEAGGLTMLPRTEIGARGRDRRVVMTTCQSHGAVGFTNLLLTKEDGVIVLNPHLADCCVLRLDERAATAVHNILGEWLG